ncbi:unnamed protein product [marine sediment metagenome]|uniref:NAD-dependent DNA ligase N-terminal domain-containing protein n=1 Tax=marine sediment metagenome TaxID=412755 RepID=X1BF75_9ZZZZ
MMAKNVKKEIKRLKDEIRHHDRRYYILDQPEISDREYDELMKRLKELEAQNPGLVTPDSPSQRVGGEPLKRFKPVKHKIKMRSLDNSYSIEELKNWDKRVHKALGKEKVEYIAEVITLTILGITSPALSKRTLSPIRASSRFISMPGFPVVPVITSDFVYIRMHGSTARYSSNYSAAELGEWAGLIKGFLKKGLDAYVYFNNDANAYAVKNALTLKELIGA